MMTAGKSENWIVIGLLGDEPLIPGTKDGELLGFAPSSGQLILNGMSRLPMCPVRLSRIVTRST